MRESPAGRAELSTTPSGGLLRIGGEWTLPHYRALATRIGELRGQLETVVQVDIDGIEALDTAGASLLIGLLGVERLRQITLSGTVLAVERRALLEAVCAAHGASTDADGRRSSVAGDLLEHLGRATLQFWRHVVALLGFIGLTLESALRILLQPRHWRLTSLVANLEKTALDAVPIIALLTFLVGAVIAFLGATVLATFGASIFTVNLVAYSFLREFGVLLTAILVAGRTASAFAAQIGSMRANEEVDAIRVLGLDPVELLVLPRVWALMIALPLLTFIAMLSGIAGGMAVCAFSLDISPAMFLSIVENIAPRHFAVGMIKAPIFAFFIAVIGCLEGFKVSGSAESVGEHTTSAVVQSIFVVIVVDALAALICMEMQW